MPPVLVTVDTGPWIDLLDRKRSVSDVERILRWQKARHIEIFASSRVFDPDTEAMDPGQQAQLRSILEGAGVEIAGSEFRIGVSRIGGPDVIAPAQGVRSADEWKRFVKVVGSDPSTLHPSSVGKSMSRKVGDYDAIYSHFGAGRDVFVTLDTKDYLHSSRRSRYRAELGLVIQSPEEFLAAYSFPTK